MRNSRSYTVDEATRKLESFCAYQERCHKEVVARLKEMRMIPEAIDLIVTHLIQHNYLNEERFARSFARGKFNIKKWGRKRIEQELKFRDISRFNIRSAMKEISNEDYFNTFEELSEKRWEQLKDQHIQLRKKKFTSYLLYRGWESQMIFDKLNELSSEL
ncbi:recombinase RecX [Leptobacterium flavescens]|uniref:Regulatory protein RecX n=1 Tax=Leptobacterium flavescens TaxID=472055 RepID=A0A6P0UMP7_9FLAO|nr:regulatory protein RecX [Leptobacterium flavescens]NER14524.1 recombinase RecX [Leptobacterium flavescens]